MGPSIYLLIFQPFIIFAFMVVLDVIDEHKKKGQCKDDN